MFPNSVRLLKTSKEGSFPVIFSSVQPETVPSSIHRNYRHWIRNHLSLVVLSFYFKWDSEVKNDNIYDICSLDSKLFSSSLVWIQLPWNVWGLELCLCDQGWWGRGVQGVVCCHLPWHPAHTRVGLILLQSSGLCCYFSAPPKECGSIWGFNKAAQAPSSEVLE